MKLATIIVENTPKTIISHDGIWYDLHQLYPYFKSLDLLSIITQDTGSNQLHQVPQDLKDNAKIPTPERFAIPYIPRQIICLGRNYAAHAKELGNKVPTRPLLFNKLPSSCIRDQDTVEIRSEYGRVDYEGEVAVIIGKPAQNIPEEEVFDAIFGYTLLNDFTARDMQNKAKDKGDPWLLAKSLKTFCPIGPYITTRDDASWPLEVDIRLTVNGETRQSGNTSQFIFDIPATVSHISKYIPLYPGDIIATGIPEGVAPVNDGDLVELSATGLGTLKNTIRQRQSP